MAFNIVLQTNTSEKNAFTKSLTTVATLSGNLRQGTSIIDPVIIVQGNLSTIKAANYMTIDTFGRSYFINNMTVINNQMIEISAHVDVLSSFKTQILNNSAIVAKQEKRWNLYLNDGQFKVYQNPIVYTQPFPGGFSGQYLLLAVAGG